MTEICQEKHQPSYFPYVDGVICLKCGLIMKKEDLEVKTEEKVSLTENLFNYKRWFNGLKKFGAIKLIPPYNRTPSE